MTFLFEVLDEATVAFFYENEYDHLEYYHLIISFTYNTLTDQIETIINTDSPLRLKECLINFSEALKDPSFFKDRNRIQLNSESWYKNSKEIITKLLGIDPENGFTLSGFKDFELNTIKNKFVSIVNTKLTELNNPKLTPLKPLKPLSLTKVTKPLSNSDEPSIPRPFLSQPPKEEKKEKKSKKKAKSKAKADGKKKKRSLNKKKKKSLKKP